jgi:hypothetical protein
MSEAEQVDERNLLTDLREAQEAQRLDLLRAIGAIEPEVSEGFDGGARESANEHPDGPEAEHNETVVELSGLAKQEKYGA